MLIDWPVAERGSRRIKVATSSSVGTIFSMPEIAMCTPGSVVVSVAFPSLVTTTTDPVSAMKKLPPEMPMSAVR